MPIIPAGLEEPPHGLTREQKHSVENEPEDFKRARLEAPGAQGLDVPREVPADSHIRIGSGPVLATTTAVCYRVRALPPGVSLWVNEFAAHGAIASNPRAKRAVSKDEKDPEE